jgi:hypothetical protein
MNPRILIVGPKAKAGYYRTYMDVVRGAGGEAELDFVTVEFIRK